MVVGVGPRPSWRRAWWALWLVGSPVLVVLAASVVWACPRRSWRVLLMVGVVQVTVLFMLVTSAVAGGSPGYVEGEVGVGDDGVGGVIGVAAVEGGAGDGPADAVGVGCAGAVLGVGAVGDAYGDVGVGGATGVGVFGDADGDGAAGDALAVGAAGGAPKVRMPGVLGAGPRRPDISSPLLAKSAVGVAAEEGGGCYGVVDVDGAAWGGR